MDIGFVKLHRKILKWEWYDDPNTMRLFIHLILLANHQTRQWRGVTIGRGQLITSIGSLAKDLKLTNQNIRTLLKKLKKTQELTIKSTNKYTMITINKYCTYHDDKAKTNKQTNNQLTNNSQTTNKQTNNQLTTTKEYKEDKNDKEGKELIKNTTCATDRFNSFWAAYPKKKSKGNAETAWNKIKPNNGLFEIIMTSLNTAKKSKDWIKENGQYIPYPASWLNAKGWEDEYITDEDKFSILEREIENGQNPRSKQTVAGKEEKIDQFTGLDDKDYTDGAW